MRLNISKSWNFGPFRLTLSRSGATFSAGFGPARVSINSKGRVNFSGGKKGFRYSRSTKINKIIKRLK